MKEILETVYHVSTFKTHSGVFKPRIPGMIEEGDSEDWTTPRICVSTSLEGCFGSMPDGGLGLQSYIDRYGGTFRVFEFELPASMIRKPTKRQVPDVEYHNERWVLEDMIATKSYLIEVIRFRIDERTSIIYDLEFIRISEEKLVAKEKSFAKTTSEITVTKMGLFGN